MRAPAVPDRRPAALLLALLLLLIAGAVRLFVSRKTPPYLPTALAHLLGAPPP